MSSQEPTEEEIQKFWEWCGFHDSWSDCSGSMKTYYLDGMPLEVDQSGNPIYPALTLNSLFKYAVPKLPYVVLENCAAGYRATASADMKASPIHYDSKPELALFRAIQEAIK